MVFVLIYLMGIIGGSGGGREGRTPPPGRPNSFDFMQFSGKFGVFTPPLEGSRPPLGKILDPPLGMVCTAGAAFQVLSLPCLHSPYSMGLTKCHSVYSDKQFQKSTNFLKTVYYIMLKFFEYR